MQVLEFFYQRCEYRHIFQSCRLSACLHVIPAYTGSYSTHKFGKTRKTINEIEFEIVFYYVEEDSQKLFQNED